MSEGGRGLFFVVSGPSGAGKSLLVRRFLEGAEKAVISVSATTRPPRVREKNGEDYFFLEEEEFRRWIAAGRFYEWAQVFGHLYGTPKRFVEEKLAAGLDIFKDIDVQGARQLKGSLGEQAVLVFVLPPDWETLQARLRQRRTESADQLQLRLQTAVEEVACRGEYDYLVVNDDLEQAAEELAAIRRAEHCRMFRRI